jgi:deazaflavin-dependent oxidoreductase (nitroreductase family)
MPLPYADPNKNHGPVFKLAETFGRSKPGQFFARRVARHIDPYFFKLTGRSYTSLAGAVDQAPLETIGAKTHEPRVHQLAYFHDGEDPILIASNFGGRKNPKWFHNLKAHPECAFGDEKFVATEVVDPQEYERLYALAIKAYAGYADYRAKTSKSGRHIPVFRLTPRSG